MAHNNEERSLQIASKQWFDYALPQVFGFHVANEVFLGRDKQAAIIQMSLLKKQGFLSGVSDWLLFWKEDLYPKYGIQRTIMVGAAIELKIGSNKLSDNQVKFRDRWTSIGGLHAMCKSMTEIESAVRLWGLTPKYATPLANERVGRQMKQMVMVDAFMPLEPRLPRLKPEDVKN